MGYYTYFNLKWEPLTEKTKEPSCPHDRPPDAKFCPECGIAVGVVDISSRISEYIEDHQDQYYGIDSEGNSTEHVKWYDYDKDMRELSRVFPSYLFTMSGEGESSDDLWVTYYLNGKAQEVKARITYDKFDRNKLS